jgi:hypothetical protein
VLLDAGDGGLDGLVHPDGDRHRGPDADRGTDQAAPVERRVGPDQRLAPGDPGDGLQRVRDQAFCAAWGTARALAHPLGDHHRRGLGRGYRGQQRVEPPDPGVAEPGALLGVAVDLDDGVVDIDQHNLVLTDAQQR